MILCQILYVSDNDRDDKEDKERVDKEKANKDKVDRDDKDKIDKDKFDKDKVDKEDEEKADTDKVNKYSANELGDRLKQIGFVVGEVCENVGFDETLKIIYEKMFSVSEVTFVI
jgi:hypothetical protein